jgi:hypothetical protein
LGPLVTDQTTDQTCDDEPLVWGVENIAKVIGRTERATFHLLEKHGIPGAQRLGGRWCMKPSVFRKSFEQGAEA